MGHRINIMIDDRVWEDFQRIPKGVRSQAVNASLAQWLTREKRQRLLQEMRAAASTVEAIGEDSVVLLRRQRYRLNPNQGEGE